MKLFQSCGQDHNNNLGKEKQKGDVRVVVREDNNKDKDEDAARHEAQRSAAEEMQSLTAMAGGGPLARI